MSERKVDFWSIFQLDFWKYTAGINVWCKSFLAVNHHNHKNWIPFILSQNLWLIFMGIKHFFFLKKDSKKLCFSKPPILNIFSRKFKELVSIFLNQTLGWLTAKNDPHQTLIPAVYYLFHCSHCTRCGVSKNQGQWIRLQRLGFGWDLLHHCGEGPQIIIKAGVQDAGVW